VAGLPHIRKIESTDLPAVTQLLEQLGYTISAQELAKRYEPVAEDRTHAVWVAVSDDQIVGFLHAFGRPALEKPPEVVIQAMVDHTMRMGGIGARLVEQSERWAKTQGYASIALSSDVDRADAHAFYERLGFKTVATSRLFRKIL